jgi:hypothetical protein
LVVELINKLYYGRSSRDFGSSKAQPTPQISIPTPVA